MVRASDQYERTAMRPVGGRMVESQASPQLLRCELSEKATMTP
jgi:hypothetical protein